MQALSFQLGLDLAFELVGETSLAAFEIGGDLTE